MNTNKLEASKPNPLLSYANDLQYLDKQGDQRHLAIFDEFKTKTSVETAIQDYQTMIEDLQKVLESKPTSSEMPTDSEKIKTEIAELQKFLEQINSNYNSLKTLLGEDHPTIKDLKITIEEKQAAINERELILNPPVKDSTDREIPTDPETQINIFQAAINDLKNTIAYFEKLKKHLTLMEKEEASSSQTGYQPLPVDGSRKDVISTRRTALRRLNRVLQSLDIFDKKTGETDSSVRDMLRIFFEQKSPHQEAREQLNLEASIEDVEMALWFAGQADTGHNRSKMYHKLNSTELENLRAKTTHRKKNDTYKEPLYLHNYLNNSLINQIPSMPELQQTMAKKYLNQGGYHDSSIDRSDPMYEIHNNFFKKYGTKIKNSYDLYSFSQQLLEETLALLSNNFNPDYLCGYLLITEQLEQYYLGKLSEPDLIAACSAIIDNLTPTRTRMSGEIRDDVMENLRNLSPTIKNAAEKIFATFLPLYHRSAGELVDIIRKFAPDLITTRQPDHKFYLQKNVEGLGDKKILNEIIRKKEKSL